MSKNADAGFSERFFYWSNQIVRNEKINLKNIPEKYGLSFGVGVINNYRAGRNNPDFKILQELKLKFPDLDLNWLITGGASSLKKMKNRDDFCGDFLRNSSVRYVDSKDFEHDWYYVIAFKSDPDNMLLRYIQYAGSNRLMIISGNNSKRSFEFNYDEMMIVGKVTEISIDINMQ
jgi:hypothetical protein